MKLLIQQRVFSWTDTYDIFDDDGNPKYFVKAEFFSLGHQIHVYEKSTQREIGVVRQKLLTLLPAFEIEIDGRIVGSIHKEFTLFHPKYNIDFNGWEVVGDFLNWEYEVTNGYDSIAHISKKIFQWSDTYVIEYSNPADELMSLLLVIAIDAANCANN
ncbi:MAG: hypothetical protein PHX08_21760 [Lachnospiraceae bacterium]|nr:hypothetical protein [Lachnospiraceae bacterium]